MLFLQILYRVHNDGQISIYDPDVADLMFHGDFDDVHLIINEMWKRVMNRNSSAKTRTMFRDSIDQIVLRYRKMNPQQTLEGDWVRTGQVRSGLE